MSLTQGAESHQESFTNYRRLKIALIIVVTFMVIEVIGGIVSGSLSLLGDAGHMLVDALALGLSLFAMSLAHRPATATRTFGYHRAEILAAMANGTVLVLVSLYIFYEAYQRFFEPPVVKTPLMITVAVIGLFANAGEFWLLHTASQANLNLKAALLHVIGDALSSIGVIAAGIIILFTNWYIADPIAAVVIGIIILWGAARIVLESGEILLEAVPREIEPSKVIDAIKKVPGVNEVHDVHIWTITSNIYALSAHVVIDDQTVSKSIEIISRVRQELADRFNISHTTLQLECESCPSGLVCEISPPPELADKQPGQMS